LSKVKIVGDTSIDKEILEEKVIDLIKERLIAIKKELNELEVDLSFYSKKYSLNEKEFNEQFANGILGDNEDYFLWEGSLKIKEKLIKEQKMLSELV